MKKYYNDSMSNITKKLVKNPVILLILVLLSTTNSFGLSGIEYPLLIPPDHIIYTKIAVKPDDLKQGLSGVKSSEFKSHQAMLFCFDKMDIRVFWMLNTYFNLDIFFLDNNLKVVDIERNMPFHPGKNNQNLIAKTRPIKAKYVLEMRSDSLLSKKIKMGTQLGWKHTKDLSQTISDARLSQ